MTRANPFKAGDRVRIFGCSAHFKHHGEKHRDDVDIVRLCEDPVWMEVQGAGFRAIVHFRQCVRLVKKSERKGCEVVCAQHSVAYYVLYCLTHRRDAEICKEKGLTE